jgi:probable HAF family extracellular repeat protein
LDDVNALAEVPRGGQSIMRAYASLAFSFLLTTSALYADPATPVGTPRLLDTSGAPSTPIAINNFGHVAGWHVAEDGDHYHAFVWMPRSGMVDIGTLGGDSSLAADINDLDQVIGWATMADGTMHAFLWTQAHGMRDLGPYGTFTPRAINNLGIIAGSLSGQAALRMPDGTFVPLGTLGGSASVALDVNDRGEVVGSSTFSDAPYSGMHPFYWSGETGMIDLHEPGTSGGAASHINNRGEVVGYLAPDLSFQSYVFTWTKDGGTVNIGGYPGGFITGTDYGNVFGINGIGQVVATSTFPGDEITRQLLWSGGAGPFVVAEDGIPDYSHMGINDVGEIAGATREPLGPATAAVWMTILTREQQVDSMRALVEDLVLRHALLPQDAKVLIRRADRDESFERKVAALVRSGRLAEKDAFLLIRAIELHAR